MSENLIEDESQWSFPKYKDVTQMEFNDKKREEEEQGKDATREFTDVKFYPYTKPGDQPVFAVVNARHILVCRISGERGTKGKGYDVIQAIVDTNPECKMYCCAWTKDTITGAPLLAAAGENSTIRIYDVLQGELIRTLVGLGGKVNDLAISPTDPNILASASGDDRLTIWSLHPDKSSQPCMAIMAGIGGHRESLLSVSFHDRGKYAASGAEDRMVKIWHIPDSFHPQAGKTSVIQYPLFSTSTIHSGHVECVKFCGDLILSKAFEEEYIVLWKIEGFSSSSPTPPVKAHSLEATLSTTFSSFCSDRIGPDGLPRPCAQYTRLLQFATPYCNYLYMRFSLYYPSIGSKFSHAILAFCNKYIEAVLPNTASETVSDPFPSDEMDIDNEIEQKIKPTWLNVAASREGKSKPSSMLSQVQSLSSNSASVPQGFSLTSLQTASSGTEQTLLNARKVLTKGELERSKQAWDRMYTIKDKWRKLRAHKSVTVPTYIFTGRQVGWSHSGEWCIVSGSENIIVVLER